MLNNRGSDHVRRLSSAFLAGDGGRKLNLLVCDDELDHTPALELLQDFAGNRDALHIVSPTGQTGLLPRPRREPVTHFTQQRRQGILGHLREHVAGLDSDSCGLTVLYLAPVAQLDRAAAF
jgi:hypothetical protein